MTFCSFCMTNVHPSSKHCRQCNRCVVHFDHHCKLLNNCIGKINYPYFVLLLLSFLSNIIILGIYSIFIIKLSVDNDNKLKIVISALLLVECAIAFISVFYLIVLHIYLIYRNITTYEYIIENRQKKVRIIDHDQKKTNSDNINDNTLHKVQDPQHPTTQDSVEPSILN